MRSRGRRDVESQPELAGAAAARLADDEALRERESAKARAEAEANSFAVVSRQLSELYGGAADEAPRRARAQTRSPTGR